MARAFGAFVRRVVLPRVPEFSRAPPEERRDAKPGSKEAAALLASQMKAAADRSFSREAVRNLTAQAARRVEAHSKDQFRRIGLKVDKEPVLNVLVNGWARDVAERVKGITADQVDKLHDILSGAGARHAETVAKDIEEQLGVTESRAAFLARDSIGTLNSKITRERYRAAKIEMYVWTTMHDDRVRDEHAELDGDVFDVDGEGDPEEGHPGEPPHCRCVQWPLPADAPDDGDQGGDGGDQGGDGGGDQGDAEEENG